MDLLRKKQSAAFLIHFPRRLALIPCSSASLDTDTPGSTQAIEGAPCCAKEAGTLPPSSTSAFIPVVAADRSLPMQSRSLDMPATRGVERLAKSERMAPSFSPAKVSASLPNGVRLTLECGDATALAAIIGALGHVQAGR